MLLKPVGLIENLTEFATVSLGGSWIAGIIAVTLGMSLCVALRASHRAGFRVLMLPIVFSGMRNNYTMANLRPKIMELQERSKELDSAGDEKVCGALAMWGCGRDVHCREPWPSA
jgi:membrane protein insertase Oxa1/YidC/SpoIIIJ